MINTFYEHLAAVGALAIACAFTPSFDASHALMFVAGTLGMYAYRRVASIVPKTIIHVPSTTREYAQLDAYVSTCAHSASSMTVINSDVADNPLLSVTMGHSARLKEGIAVKKTPKGFEVMCSNERTFSEMMARVKHEWSCSSRGQTPVLISSKDGWRPLTRRHMRNPSSIVGSGSYAAMKDLSQNIPHETSSHKRVYLFYGAKSTGKMATVHAFASILRCAVCVCLLTVDGMSDDMFVRLINTAPDSSIVVLEDIDKVLPHSNLSSGGVARALDGTVASKGVYVLTATDLKDVHSEFIKPGTGIVDVLVHYTLATMDDARRLFELQYGTEQSDLAERFSELAGEGVLAAGLIVSILVANAGNARMAILQLFKLRHEMTADDANEQETISGQGH